MRILTCLVTHNRLEYTRRAAQAFFATKHSEDVLVIVDNASSDGTQDWLKSVADDQHFIHVVLNRRNLFPGAATNIGWHRGLSLYPDVTHLMRLDNDVELLPGWREEVERVFSGVDGLGIFGFLNRHEDYDGNQPVDLDETGAINVHWDQVGGNCVIPRRFWDEGLRWNPGAWRPGGMDEDSIFSAEIRARGYTVGTTVPTIANNMSFHRYEDFPDYYNQTATMRGLVPELSV